jgi:hypothetical protein
VKQCYVSTYQVLFVHFCIAQILHVLLIFGLEFRRQFNDAIDALFPLTRLLDLDTNLFRFALYLLRLRPRQEIDEGIDLDSSPFVDVPQTGGRIF